MRWLPSVLGLVLCVGMVSSCGEPEPTRCTSSRQCSAEGLVCDTERRQCVECLADADCLGENEVCLGRVCEQVRTCISSRQCPGQVCHPDRFLCVDCVDSIDCSRGQECRDSRCQEPRARCRSDRDCLVGQVCDDDGVCRNRVTEPGDECVPTELECVGRDQVRRCGNDGRWEPAQACPAGAICLEGRCGTVSDPCATCRSDEACVNGLCVPGTCSPGCSGDEVCQAGTCRCGAGPRCEVGTTCQDGRCVPADCSPACALGETCRDGACRCGTGPACGSREVCEGGRCVPSACDPLCRADERCQEGRCVPITCSPACAPGEDCTAGQCRCGNGPACTAGQSCVNGRCTSETQCTASPCDLAPQCGCGSQACDIDRNRTRACRQAGSRGQAEACASATDCRAGFTCQGGQSPYCLKFCAADRDCAGESLCGLVLLDASGMAIPDARLCSLDCDPRTAAGCPAGTACQILSADQATGGAVAICRDVTFFFPGFCTQESECPVGEVCDGGACKRYCRVGVASDCPGSTCTALEGRPRLRGSTWGTCN